MNRTNRGVDVNRVSEAATTDGRATESRGYLNRGESMGEIEYIEKIVQVPEVVLEERIRHVPKIEVQECVIEVPKIVYKEKIVEVEEIEYKEVPVERMVEVPEVREEIIIREVPVPRYVEKPVPEYVTVEVPNEVERKIPVPVDVSINYELVMPVLNPKYKVVKIPVYVPRFIELPFPSEFLPDDFTQEVQILSQQIHLLTQQQAPSLAEIERLAEFAKSCDYQSHMRLDNIKTIVQKALKQSNINQQPISMNSHRQH